MEESYSDLKEVFEESMKVALRRFEEKKAFTGRLKPQVAIYSRTVSNNNV